jgi:hypothetical protein
MSSTGDWTVDTIEVPASVLWKRTLMLSVTSIGLGLGAGYLLGRSFPLKETPATSQPRPITRVRFLPIADLDPGERIMVSGDEVPAIRMPPAYDTPEQILPAVGKAQPALMRMEMEAQPQPDKG